MNKKINVVITAGGTSEPIDNVRKITNSSSGKLGCVIAEEILKLENLDKIYYICSKSSYKPTSDKVKVVEIVSTSDLKENVEEILVNENIDYFIHSMAVSDYTIDYVTTASRLAKTIDSSEYSTETAIRNNNDNITDTKISSYEDNLIIKLKPTPKIINIIKNISPNTYLVGFKLLDNVSDEELISVACKLKVKNKCDLVVANDLSNIRNGKHKAFIIKDEYSYIIANDKKDIAKKLVKEITNG